MTGKKDHLTTGKQGDLEHAQGKSSDKVKDNLDSEKEFYRHKSRDKDRRMTRTGEYKNKEITRTGKNIKITRTNMDGQENVKNVD